MLTRRRFLFSLGCAVLAVAPMRASADVGDDIRAAYLSSGQLENPAKVRELVRLIEETELNAIVIDVKDSRVLLDPRHLATLRLFKERGVYVIGRLITFQDSRLALDRKDLAVRSADGGLFLDGNPRWRRYWVDPAAKEAQDWNIAIAKRVIDAGVDEVNFDYIRFPHQRSLVYPHWDLSLPKHAVMEEFFARLRRELDLHAAARGVRAKLSIDVYGYVYLNGIEPGVGQRLLSAAKYFDVVAPMAYPSHYQCNEFGLKDPNLHPALVYERTLAKGLETLRAAGVTVATRPWIQDFSVPNIYGCRDPKRSEEYVVSAKGNIVVKYGAARVRAQIEAAKKLGVRGFMLWNPESSYTENALLRKNN